MPYHAPVLESAYMTKRNITEVSKEIGARKRGRPPLIEEEPVSLAPLKFEETKAEISKLDTKGLDKAFAKLGFKSIRERLPKIETIAQGSNRHSHPSPRDGNGRVL